MNYNKIRRKSRSVKIGNVYMGGTAPIVIQTMANTDTHDQKATVAQILALADAGSDIVRIAVPDLEAAETVKFIRQVGISVPIVADIHFDWKIALKCAEYGVDKIRINPGNIGDEERVRAVCDICKSKGIPIRIGVNSGSLEKTILAKYGAPTAQALCDSALYHASLLEKFGFEDTVLSIKSSNVSDMIAANRLLAQKCDYPIHLGVTEAGSENIGVVKSAVGIGALLCDGIGDTIRVSLTDDPLKEVEAAKKILKALNIEGQAGMDIISCPTCGRTCIDLIEIVKRFENAVAEQKLGDIPIKVAIMGCAVNGPGEAREADIGIAGGKGEALLISHGEIIGKVPENEVVETLISYIKDFKNKTTK